MCVCVLVRHLCISLGLKCTYHTQRIRNAQQSRQRFCMPTVMSPSIVYGKRSVCACVCVLHKLTKLMWITHTKLHALSASMNEWVSRAMSASAWIYQRFNFQWRCQCVGLRLFLLLHWRQLSLWLLPGSSSNLRGIWDLREMGMGERFAKVASSKQQQAQASTFPLITHSLSFVNSFQPFLLFFFCFLSCIFFCFLNLHCLTSWAAALQLSSALTQLMPRLASPRLRLASISCRLKPKSHWFSMPSAWKSNWS